MSVFNILTRFVFFFYGTLCPAYNTYKTLAEHGEQDFQDWAKYWIVYPFLICLEVVSDFMFSWMPMYALSKLMLVIWLVVSAPQASVWIFDGLVAPMLVMRQRDIDDFMQRDKKQMLSDFFDGFTQLVVRSRNVTSPWFWYVWLKIKSQRLRQQEMIMEEQDSALEDNLSGSRSSQCVSEINVEPDQEDELVASTARTHLPERRSSHRSVMPSIKLVGSSFPKLTKNARPSNKIRIDATAQKTSAAIKEDAEDELLEELNEAEVEQSLGMNMPRSRPMTGRRRIGHQL